MPFRPCGGGKAEACAVIMRLEKLITNGNTNIDPVETPAQPAAPAVKDIVVTTASATDTKGVKGTAYSITDNGFATGYLGNGKPINEANVQELLEKAKTIWPNGMTWTSPGTANNNWYINSNTVASSIPNLHGTNSSGNNGGYECTGFAVMLSDYLFGKNSNPWTEVTNFADIRPGDIIVQYEANGTPHHALVATGINKTGSRAGYVFVAEGNLGNVIHWPGTNGWDAAGPEDLAVYGSYRAYTRWPS